MSKQTLKDHTGRTLGTIDTSSNGEQVIKDHTGRTLGKYKPKENKTFDHTGRTVGTGNLLTSLLR